MDSLRTEFDAPRGELFMLALKTAALTVLTLGLYRFWARTRLRRFYFAHVKIGGTGFQYMGTGLEKLTGFLVAMILLAFYISAANVLIMTASVLWGQGPALVINWAPVALPVLLLPLYFLASYRARAYLLSRTAWRGVAFGMGAGAWGYTWRATMYVVLTVLSAGLLWPLMTFRLEKYLTDRTWFGDTRFVQGGSVWSVYPFLLAPLVPVLTVAAISGYFAMQSGGLAMPSGPGEILLLSLTLMAAVVAIAVGIVYYRVATTRVLWSMKILGPGIETEVAPRTGRIIGIHIWGSILTSLGLSLVSTVLFGILMGILAALGLFTPEMLLELPPGLAAGLAVATFAVTFVLWSAFRQTFITYPLVAHIAETVEVHEPDLLSTIRARGRAGRGPDADGFADALDVGAAF